jgi:hypothetical protein
VPIEEEKEKEKEEEEEENCRPHCFSVCNI